jgi:DNA repair photolyase
MRVLRPFDPWQGELCTCPPKYTLNPYTGCAHRCLYCYISSFIPRAFEVREKSPFLHLLEKDLKEREKTLYLSLANSSDPYPPVEAERELTRAILKLCQREGMPVLILTKSPLVVRDADLLQAMQAAVSITITTLDSQKARLLEPGAPPPKDRVRALQVLAKAGIPTILRLDPIIPGINDAQEEWRTLLSQLAPYIRQVVASTLKLRWDTGERIAISFPEVRRFLPLFSERKGRSLYLERKTRYALLGELREIVHAHNIPFSTCREGFPEFNDLTCDGSALFSR